MGPLRVIALTVLGILFPSGPTIAAQGVNVLTHHNGNDRTGSNLQETVLNTSNVNGSAFGRLLSVPLDGNSFGQPLYVSQVRSQGEMRPMVFVATSHNSVYGIDASSGVVIWRRNLGASIPRIDISQFSHSHMPRYIPPYYDLYPEIGITSTPVIDLSLHALYVVAKTKTATGDLVTYRYSLHVLDIATGAEKADSPVVIDGQVGADGRPVTSGGTAQFDAFLALNRTALLLTNHRVFIAFSSQGDVEDAKSRPFHGWIFGYDAAHLKAPPLIFCTTPDTHQGGIWQSGGGLALDSDGNLLVVTGNGPEGGASFGNSVISLAIGTNLSVRSWFSPANSDFLNRWDLDLGSSGLLVLPGPDLKDRILVGGKDGLLYMLDSTRLGSGHPKTPTDAAVQALRITPEPSPRPEPPTYHGPPQYNGPNDWHHLHGTPVFWRGPQGPTVYLWPEMDKLKAFRASAGGLSDLQESETSAATGMPGAALSLSANAQEAGSGILWASRPFDADANRRNVAGILEAYDASHIANARPLWTNRLNIGRDGGGFFAKYSPPTIADGRVFLSTFAPETADRRPVAGKTAALVEYGLLAVPQTQGGSAEEIDKDVVRFFASDSARRTAEPSYAMPQPLTGLGPPPATFHTRPVFAQIANSETATLAVSPGTSLYGTGMVFGHLLRNGQSTKAWNMDNYGYPYYNDHAPNLYQAHPWVLAVRADGSSFGVLADTTREIQIDTTRDIVFRSDTPFPVVVIERSSPQEVLKELARLTGYMPLPPKWALGFQQSHFSYTPELEVLNIGAQARRARIPLDAVWVDIDYMDHYRIFSFSPKTFADAKALNQDLTGLALHGIWMIDPAVRQETAAGVSRVFDTGSAQDVWIKLADGKTIYRGPQWPAQDPDKSMRTSSVFPDFTSPSVRTWWGTQFAPFIAQGVDGVWNDMNEPAVFVDTLHTMPLDNRHVGDPALANYAGQAQGAERAAGAHSRYHNVYGMLMARATREGIQKAQPDRRPFVLARANFIGGQRYAAAWTGDNTANWEHLGISIPMLLNLGMSGQPFVGADIGGYRYSKDEKPPLTPADDAKLYARWLGLGAMYPFSRAHYERNFGPQGTKPPGWAREPWVYSPELVESNRRAVNRRYRLLPYFYTIFQEAGTTGLPVMRPVFFANPKDPKLRAIDDEFLIGSDLLVAVQLKPSGSPPGVLPDSTWRKFGFPIADGHAESDLATKDLPALYVRGGAIIPTGPLMQFVDEKPLDPLTLIIALGVDGTAVGTLYEDAGDGFEFGKGGYRLTVFNAKTENGELVISSTHSGKWPAAVRNVAVRVLLDGREIDGSGREGTAIHIALRPQASDQSRSPLASSQLSKLAQLTH
jgi:alpha-glucosidase